MKKQRSTSGRRPYQPPRPRRAVAPIASLIAIFVISLAATTGLVHMLVNQFAADSVSLLDLATSEAALLILAATVVATLVVGSLMLMLWPSNACDLPRPKAESTESAPAAVDEESSSPQPRQILRLTRSAERLDVVEQDLIRAMANGEPLTDYTRKLLAEMRVCTCKLLGELSDFDRHDEETGQSEEKETEAVGR